jgi:hypothetical protein
MTDADSKRFNIAPPFGAEFSARFGIWYQQRKYQRRPTVSY